MAIFLIAILLMAVSAGSAWQAWLLVPTDLGLAFMTGAYIAGSAGFLALGLGAAARQVRQPQVGAAGPARIEPPVGQTAAPAGTAEPDRPADLGAGKAAVIAAAGAAFGAAGVGALSPANAGKQTGAAPAIAERTLDELEQELFSELPALPRRPDLAGAPAAMPVAVTKPPALEPAEPADRPEASPATSEAATSGPEAAMLPEARPDLPVPRLEELVHEPEEHFAPDLVPPLPMDDLPDATEPREDQRDAGTSPMTEGAPAGPEPEPPVSDPEYASPALDPALGGPAPAAPGAEAARPVPGLIADADLAALQTELPPLEPLDRLEEVGSYESGGTRFTMYSDGSVNTIGPEGERRFRTLDELRKHLDLRGR